MDYIGAYQEVYTMTDKIKQARKRIEQHRDDLTIQEYETILRALTALEKLQAIDGKALGEAITQSIREETP